MDDNLRLFGIRPETAPHDAPPVAPSPPTVGDELRDKALDSVESVFEAISARNLNANAAKVIAGVDNVMEELVRNLHGESKALVNINNLRSYDEYTFHHSLSVSVLTVATGRALGMNKWTLKRLGMCAILHDVGKTAVPIDIINKTGKLNPDEFETVKYHPTAGVRYLRETNMFDRDVLFGVMCHHEKLDGTGYPNKLKGDDIPLWARIIAVADVYDALTSNRPYRRPMQPAEAVEYILGGAGTHFDLRVVQAFIKRLEIYPIGSRVLLSDGAKAVVLGSESPMRPLVRLEETGEVADLSGDPRYLNVTVKSQIEE